MQPGKRLGKLGAPMALCALSALGLSGAAHGGELALEASSARPTPTPPEPSVQRAYIDPATGELTPIRPAGVTPSAPAARASLNTSSAGLQPVMRPDGSVIVDLQGRFRSTLGASIAPDGAVMIEHLPPAGNGLEAAADRQ